MRRPLMTWLLGGALALTATAWAQTPPVGEEGKTKTATKIASADPAPQTTTTTTTTTTEHTSSGHTVRREDVKTWTITVDGEEYEAHPATPAYEGETGLFHMSTAYSLPKGKFSFSLFRDNVDRDPKDLDASTHGVSLGFGVSNRLEIHGNFGIQQRNDTDALFQAGYPNEFPFVRTPWETGVGDLKLGAKFKLLDDYMGDPVGLAIRGFVKIPTADETIGLGTGKASWGGDLILSKSIDAKLDLHGSIGFVKNGDPDGVNLANAFRWGLGLNVPACTNVQLQAEIMGTKYGDSDFDQTNPLDLVVGPVFWIKGFFIRPAISWNLNFDDRGLNSSSKSWTGRHLAIGWYPGFACRKIEGFVPPPPPPPPPGNNNPSVNCEIERSVILPGESVRVRANASDTDGDTLTYEWRTTAGRIVGSGSSVTFESTGMAPGSSATITVRVSDGRGGSAESTCSVRIRAEERRPEAITCIAGGFPRNLARLNNVDKACLDDVASRLRQDPRSRVIIVGHADSGERYPEVIARRRAEAVKAYLVKDKGIEESRITTRSAGATKPLDTGTDAMARAKNRRVEVIFVPEGATVPEDDD
jgi:outer membrane protein OmpA-like peptidoglycan-associated protein